MINLKDNLEIIISILAIVGIVYKIATIESRFYSSTDKVRDEVSDRVNCLEKALDLHIQASKSTKEMLDYKLTAQSARLSKKVDRVELLLRDTQHYLAKHSTFKVRQDAREDNDS